MSRYNESSPAAVCPVAVFGMTLYNNSEFLAEAIRSIEQQSFQNFAVVMVDDCSQDQTERIAVAQVAKDSRFTFHRNAARLGMIGTWRKVFEIAKKEYPSMKYFAWASDHDVWEKKWLEKLLAILMADAGAVMVYPLAQRIDEQGNKLSHDILKGVFSTAGCHRAVDRFRAVTRLRRNFGNMVYGLYRAEALSNVGVYRDVFIPDRLLMQELALEGGLVQIEEVLWLRRFRKSVSLRSQRSSLWANAIPKSSFLPWEIVHSFYLLLRMLEVRGAHTCTGELFSMALEQLRFCIKSLIARRFGLC